MTDKNAVEAELKACPCGQVPEIEPVHKRHAGFQSWQVQCARCGRQGAFTLSRETAATLWNNDFTRSLPDTVAPVVAGDAPERIWINLPDKVVDGVNECWWYENPMAFPTIGYVHADTVAALVEVVQRQLKHYGSEVGYAPHTFSHDWILDARAALKPFAKAGE